MYSLEEEILHLLILFVDLENLIQKKEDDKKWK